MTHLGRPLNSIKAVHDNMFLSRHDIGGEPVAEANARPGDAEPFPALPTELIILIFEYAAQDSKATAASLSLVSHFAHATVLPLLFRTLVLQQRTSAYGLSRFLHAHPRVAVLVRELWMRQSIGSDALLVLPCVRLDRLAVNPSCFNALCRSSETLSSVLREEFEEHAVECASLCTPRELLVFPGCPRWGDLFLGASRGYAHSFFQNLTHLWLTQASQLHELLHCQELTTALSRLTNLAAPVAGLLVKVAVQDVLKTFPALLMFVIMPQPRHDPWLTHWRWGAASEVDASYYECTHVPRDSRVYFLDADGQKAEDILFKAWKKDALDVWTCAKPIIDLDV